MRRLLPLALLAAACIDDLEPQYRVTDLRILAVRAEVPPPTDAGTTWADAMPGATLRLEALVANPLGRGPLEVSWYACIPPGIESVTPCVDEQTLRDPGALAARAADPASGVLFLGTGAAISYGIPAELAAALVALEGLALDEPTWACRLYAEVPVVAVAEAEGLREVAVKRVRLTPDPATVDPSLAGAYVRNSNPALLEIRHGTTEEACAAGATVTPASFPAERTFLCGAVSAGAQPFNVCGPAGEWIPTPESLSWQWYVTAGEFPEVGGVGNATGGTPEFIRPRGPFALWVILRDGRGGEGWLPLQIDALGP